MFELKPPREAHPDIVSPEEHEGYYILDANNRPVPTRMDKWQNFPEQRREVAHTVINDNLEVSTSFRGVDDAFDDPDEHEVYLFETISLIGEDHGEEGIWQTWDEALIGHREAVERLSKLYGSSDANG